MSYGALMSLFAPIERQHIYCEISFLSFFSHASVRNIATSQRLPSKPLIAISSVSRAICIIFSISAWCSAMRLFIYWHIPVQIYILPGTTCGYPNFFPFLLGNSNICWRCSISRIIYRPPSIFLQISACPSLYKTTKTAFRNNPFWFF